MIGVGSVSSVNGVNGVSSVNGMNGVGSVGGVGGVNSVNGVSCVSSVNFVIGVSGVSSMSNVNRKTIFVMNSFSKTLCLATRMCIHNGPEPGRLGEVAHSDDHTGLGSRGWTHELSPS